MNMSYCMFENTLRSMMQIRNALIEVNTIEELDMGPEEKAAFDTMPEMMAAIGEEMDRLREMEGFAS